MRDIKIVLKEKNHGRFLHKAHPRQKLWKPFQIIILVLALLQKLCCHKYVILLLLQVCFKWLSCPDMLINEYPHIHRCNVIWDMLVVMHVIIDVTLFSKLCCPRYASPWSLQLVYRSFMLSHICSLSVKTSLLQKARRCPRYASFWFAPIGFQ